MQRYRILIAHDAPLFQAFLERVVTLCYPSATVIHCTDGAAALRAYDAQGADLLITDFDMPHMDGPTLIRALRARQIRLPIIGLSGEPANAQHLYAAGADGFLSPPFSVADFRTLAHRLLLPSNMAC